MTNEEFDAAVRAEGYGVFCGVDEAGRGPLAGPVCAAAVILDPAHPIEGLNDSKKLTEKQRDRLFDEIQAHAVAYHVAFADVEEIEQINILQATFRAMVRAVNGLSVTPMLALVDGNGTPPLMSVPARCVVKGDALSASIAAASILAKVSRDRLMMEWDQQYPQYGFAKHKGYGPSPVHRLSFLRKFYEKQQ